MAKFNKDAWFCRALQCGYIKVTRAGEVYRRNADGGYDKVKLSTHKKYGRVYWQLTFEGITKSVLVNRAVALRYLPNPLNLPEVNHLDGVKAHNWLSNLEWSTKADNEKHAARTGLKATRGSGNSNAKLSAEQVLEIRRRANERLGDLAKEFGVAPATINSIRQRKTWTHV